MRVRIVVPVFFVSIAVSALAFSQNFAHRPNVPPGATEALAAFDDQSNGFVAEQADHIADAMQFNEHDSLTQGLGPLHVAPAISIQLPAASARLPNCAPGTSTAMASSWTRPEARSSTARHCRAFQCRMCRSGNFFEASARRSIFLAMATSRRLPTKLWNKLRVRSLTERADEFPDR